MRLGEWWARVNDATGPLDFFHHHLWYRCDSGTPAERWLREHRVQDRPVGEVLHVLSEKLETHARQLDAIEDHYLAGRERPDPAPGGVGLRAEFDACPPVLASA